MRLYKIRGYFYFIGTTKCSANMYGYALDNIEKFLNQLEFTHPMHGTYEYKVPEWLRNYEYKYLSG